jgi:hypothetical protein
MEIFELLDLGYVLVQACGCFLEFMAVGSTVGTGVSAVKVQKNKVARRAAQQAGEAPPPQTAWRWAFWVLLGLSVLLSGLVVWRWVRQ